MVMKGQDPTGQAAGEEDPSCSTKQREPHAKVEQARKGPRDDPGGPPQAHPPGSVKDSMAPHSSQQ